MGKFAQYAKRGTARQQGFLAPPPSSGFTIGSITSSGYQSTRTASYPPGATDWSMRTLLASTRAQVFAGGIVSGTGPITASGLTTVTAYIAQYAWYAGTRQLSDWGGDTNVTTI